MINFPNYRTGLYTFNDSAMPLCEALNLRKKNENTGNRHFSFWMKLNGKFKSACGVIQIKYHKNQFIILPNEHMHQFRGRISRKYVRRSKIVQETQWFWLRKIIITNKKLLHTTVDHVVFNLRHTLICEVLFAFVFVFVLYCFQRIHHARKDRDLWTVSFRFLCSASQIAFGSIFNHSHNTC